MILCLSNGKAYIGSSLNVRARINSHKRRLAAGTHINVYLQRAYNKYGASSFRWKIVSKNPANRFVEEQTWIESLRTFDRRHGYNLSYPVRVQEPNPHMSRKIKNLWESDNEYRKSCEAGLLKGSRKVSSLLKNDPKFSAKISKIRKGQFGVFALASISVKAKARYQDPVRRKQHLDYLSEGRKKLAELRKSPEFVTNQVRGIIKQWDNPERRKQQAERMKKIRNKPELQEMFKAHAVKAISAYNATRKINKSA